MFVFQMKIICLNSLAQALILQPKVLDSSQGAVLYQAFQEKKKIVTSQRSPTVHKATFPIIVKILTGAWDISVVILYSHSH